MQPSSGFRSSDRKLPPCARRSTRRTTGNLRSSFSYGCRRPRSAGASFDPLSNQYGSRFDEFHCKGKGCPLSAAFAVLITPAHLGFPSNLVPRTSNLPLERRAHRQPKRLPRLTKLVRRPIQLERFLVAEPPGVRVGEQAAER